MIPRTHPLAGVGDAFNAVFVEAEAAGQLMFYGRGAGGAPTAQRGARRPRRGRPQPARPAAAAPSESRVRGPAGPADGRGARPATTSPRRRRPAGVLATVAQAFAAHDVSIATVRQAGRGDGRDAW